MLLKPKKLIVKKLISSIVEVDLALAYHVGVAALGGMVLIGIPLTWFFWNKVKALKQQLAQERFLATQQTQSQSQSFKQRSEQLVRAERIRLEKQYYEVERELREKESALEQRAQLLEGDKSGLQDSLTELKRQEAEVNRKRTNLENLRQLYRRRLIQLSQMSMEEAKKELEKEVTRECQEDIRKIRHDLFARSIDEVENESKRVLIDTMQRLTSNAFSSVNGSLVKIPSEDIKGRLIGRDGRNIKSFETATGTNLVVDETPGVVMVSAFDPVRRTVGKLALENLVQDGRVHPASIEESARRAKDAIEKEIYKQGAHALEQVRIENVHPEVVSLLGKLHYRLSNNQNTLEHSIEVAQLAGMLGAEIGIDQHIARRCGLFHDLGKAISADSGESHALAAARLLKQHGECPEVIEAIASSHDHVIVNNLYAGVLQVADALSATRPGARLETAEGYAQRIKSLEGIAQGLEGVLDAYALQAGKEIRIIVSPERYDDYEAYALAVRVRRKIEAELSYPGSIRVTVVREQRFVEKAR